MSEGWDMQAIDTLRRMWIEGATFTEIARAVGKSRNGVAGKVNRLGLPKRGEAHIARMAAKNARKRWDSKPRTPTKQFSLRRTTPKERKPPMFMRVVSVPESNPVPLMKRTGCCYPVTAEGPHLFCDLPTSRGDYCQAHFKVMRPRGKAA